MKKTFIVVSLLLLSTSAFAWAIGPMNYQGRLLNNSGIPLTGSYNFTVRIYDAASGGALKYSEQQNSIAVDDGVYSFLVSTGTSPIGTWDINLWNTPTLYMEIAVNGQTLTPSQLLAAAPFAFQANIALTTNNALALGGKTATEYNNTLADICESSKGKWLELVGKCLGIGASFPGPTMAALSTLTASTDLSGLDLSKADISGINFGNANFTGTLFKGTTLNPAGIQSANMTGVTMDGIISSGAAGTFTANFTNAFISNADLWSWHLAGANLTGISTSNLSNCYPVLPANYKCTGKAIFGPGINLSENSLMKNALNVQSIGLNAFYDISMANMDFTGNQISSVDFPGDTATDMSNAKFQRTTIYNMIFSGNLTGTLFDQAVIKKTRFRYVNFLPTAPSFNGTELSFIWFETIASGSALNFNNALLSNILFRGAKPQGYGQNITLNINDSRVTNLVVEDNLASLTITDSFVVGGLSIPVSTAIPSIVIGGGNSTFFEGGVVSGNFTGANLTFTAYNNVSFRGANFTSSTGLLSSNMVNVDWYGAKCPDGFQVTTLGGTCIGHGI